MILTLVEKNLDGSAVEVSLEALTFARNLSAVGGGVPVDAVVVGDGVPPTSCARSWRRTASATSTPSAATPRRRTPAPAGPRRSCRCASRARRWSSWPPGTDRGNELMAHVAARAGVAMAANVLSFHGLAPFVVTRQVVGGAALEEMLLDQRPAVFSVAGHAVEATPADVPGAADVVELTPEIAAADLVARVVVHRAARGRRVRLAEVGARRRRRGPRCRRAGRLRGPAGADRAARARRWASPGWSPAPAGGRTTSRSARPAAGSRRSSTSRAASAAPSSTGPAARRPRRILAINTDAEAPMVTRATYAVIGDLHEVVPAINEEIRRRRGLTPAPTLVPGRADDRGTTRADGDRRGRGARAVRRVLRRRPLRRPEAVLQRRARRSRHDGSADHRGEPLGPAARPAAARHPRARPTSSSSAPTALDPATVGGGREAQARHGACSSRCPSR